MEGAGREPLPPTVSFDAALATLQSASHRLSRERQAWVLERQDLLGRVAALAQEKQQLLGLHELLLGRVSMLEFALQAERRARRGDAPTDAAAAPASVTEPPPRPPALDAAAERPRASQAIIQEYLAVIEQAEASAAARNVGPSDPVPPPQRPAAGNVGTPAPAGGAGAAPFRTPESASVPLPFFSMPPLPPTPAQAPAPPPPASPRASGDGNGAAFADALASSTPTAGRASLASIAAKAAAAAAAVASADPSAVEPRATSPAPVAEGAAAPVAAGRRRVSITGGKPRPGGAAEAARAPRIRGGAAATGSPPALPAAWQQSAVLRSHVDVLREGVWLPGRVAVAGASAAAPPPLLLSCSDDGTAKVWAIPPAASRSAGGGGRKGLAGAAGGGSRALDAGDVTEPLRTFRCGRAVLRASVLSWVPVPSSGGEEEGGVGAAFVRACVAAASSDDGLSSALASALSDATRRDAVGVLACSDGSLCVVVLPSAEAPSASGNARPPPSTYDLPSAASLPCLREAAAHGDSIWAVVQAPPGYLVAPVLDALGDSVPGRQPAGDTLTELPPGADTRDVPVFLTAGADGLLRLWRLGLRSSDGRPGLGLLASIAPGALPSPISGSATGELAPAAAGLSSISAAAFDLVAPGLTAWVSCHGSESITKLDLASGGRVVLRARLRTPVGPAFSGPPAPMSVTAIVPHPQLPLVFAATSAAACGVAVFDALSGALLHSLPAHSAGVASISVDPTGALLASCGVDGDVRVWSVESRKCIWSTRAHRGKHSETALGVAFHPSAAALLASVGADSLAKVFTPHASLADEAAGGGAVPDVPLY